MLVAAGRRAGARGVAAAARRMGTGTRGAGLVSPSTADTLRTLRRRFPRARFVWLMGGDNLAQLPYWKRWQEIFRTAPIAVFDRPRTALTALAGIAARRFARARLPVSASRRLALMAPPAWVFFHTRLDPRSATRIRAERMPQTVQEKEPEGP